MSTVRDRLLADAKWYHLFKVMIRAEKQMRLVAEEYGHLAPGDKVLDVGCGDGDIRPFLGDVDYTGIDFNDDYLRVAKEHENASTRFIAADVSELEGLGLGPFDLALGIGLLHHLSDAENSSLLEGIAAALKPGGRLITIDPLFHPEQRTTARVLAALDRGRYVRDQSGYERVIGEHLTVERSDVYSDLLIMPYTHCVIEARRSV